MADSAPSAELVAIDDPEAMIAALRGEIAPMLDDPEAIAQRMVEQILAADDPDAVLSGLPAADHAQDVIGRGFQLQNVRLLRSRLDDGDVFAILEGLYLDDGEPAVITCSGRRVMAQAIQLKRLDALPRDVKLRKAEQATAAGYYPLDLEAA